MDEALGSGVHDAGPAHFRKEIARPLEGSFRRVEAGVENLENIVAMGRRIVEGQCPIVEHGEDRSFAGAGEGGSGFFGRDDGALGQSLGSDLKVGRKSCARLALAMLTSRIGYRSFFISAVV